MDGLSVAGFTTAPTRRELLAMIGKIGGAAAMYQAMTALGHAAEKVALDQGSVFHPEEYRREYMNGVSVPWSRLPWIMGCTSRWTAESRAEHYANMVTLDGRIVLAGEHASYVGGWMEGSMLSALDAIRQVHARARAA